MSSFPGTLDELFKAVAVEGVESKGEAASVRFGYGRATDSGFESSAGGGCDCFLRGDRSFMLSQKNARSDFLEESAMIRLACLLVQVYYVKRRDLSRCPEVYRELQTEQKFAWIRVGFATLSRITKQAIY